jgi:putative peptidoglycan lipid II flippase
MASLIWTLTLLASRVIGLVRESVLGATLGASSQADAYAAAFRVPDNVAYVISGSALSIIFIPMFTGYAQRGEEDRAWRAFSVVASFIVALLAVVTPLAWLAMPQLAPLFAPGFSPEDTALLVRLSRIVLPAQIFHILGGLLSAALLAKDRHAVPALAPLVYTLGIIAGGLLGQSAEGFAWGVLGGAFAGPFLLPFWAARGAGMRWSFVLDAKDPDLRTYLARSLPVMLGFSIVAMDDTAWTRFGSALAPGTVAVLNYAKTLMKVPMGVFGLAMGVAAYPTITKLVAEGRPGEAYATLLATTRRTLLLAFAAQVALTVAGPELGTLVLGAGRIVPAQMEQLGSALGWFSVGLGGWTAQTLLARGFYARGQAWLPTWLGFGVLIAALPLYKLLGERFGAEGLAAASSLAILVYTALLGWRLRRSTEAVTEIPLPAGFVGFLARAVPATALAIAAGLWMRGTLGALPPDRLQAALRVGLLAGVCAPVWLLATWALGVEELPALWGMVRRRFKRAPAA